MRKELYGSPLSTGPRNFAGSFMTAHEEEGHARRTE